MWRAQPSLSGATCPAGSKTSCCESSSIFWQSFCFPPSLLPLHFLYPPISSSAAWIFCHVFFFNLLHSIIFLPHFPVLLLHPQCLLSQHCFSKLFLSAFNNYLMLFFICSPSLLLPLSSSSETLAPSQLFFPRSHPLNTASWSSSAQLLLFSTFHTYPVTFHIHSSHSLFLLCSSVYHSQSFFSFKLVCLSLGFYKY